MNSKHACTTVIMKSWFSTCMHHRKHYHIEKEGLNLIDFSPGLREPFHLNINMPGMSIYYVYTYSVRKFHVQKTHFLLRSNQFMFLFLFSKTVEAFFLLICCHFSGKHPSPRHLFLKYTYSSVGRSIFLWMSCT